MLVSAPHPGGTRSQIRIWKSDALAPTSYLLAGEIVLDRNLLGNHATRDPHQAPLLTWHGDKVRVTVRKQNRVVFGIPGRLFDDFPGHPGAFGRYWTWVAHPELDETLILMSRRPPQQASCLEGRLRLYRMEVRPIRVELGGPLEIAPPCVIVAGLGAIEVSNSSASTRLTRPEPLAKFDLDDLRRQLQYSTATRLLVPCVVPNKLGWCKEENEAATSLAQTLDRAYPKDLPDWLPVPSYLPGSVPGIIMALRRRQEQRWVLSGTGVEYWFQREWEPDNYLDEGRGEGDLSLAAQDRGTPEEREPDRHPDEGKDAPSSTKEDLFPDFVIDDYDVKFDSNYYKNAAEGIVKGGDYKPNQSTPAAMGAWRRAACIYALYMQRNMQLPEHRDLRKYGWSDKMARCVERWVDDLGTDTRAWLSGDDGPRIFMQYLTVRRKGGGSVLDVTEPLAALIDKLVRPHGRTTIRKRR